MRWNVLSPGVGAQQFKIAHQFDLVLYGTGLVAFRLQVEHEIGQAENGVAREQGEDRFLRRGERQVEQGGDPCALLFGAVKAPAQQVDDLQAILLRALHELDGLLLQGITNVAG